MATPNLDWYVGRQVTHVNDLGDGKWELVFDGGISIINEDDELPMPEERNLVGYSFTNLVMTAEWTTMHFSTQAQVTLNPNKYAISDARFTEESGPVYPQRSEASPSPLPDDPSPDRVIDAPLPAEPPAEPEE